MSTNMKAEALKEMGKRIKDARTSSGLTQEELAQKVGYKSRTSINKIELGKTDISQSQVLKMAKVLGCSPAWLTGWENDSGEIDLGLVAIDLGISIDEASEYIKEMAYKKENPASKADGEDELAAIYRSLDASTRPKLLELARLYLNEQRKSE